MSWSNRRPINSPGTYPNVPAAYRLAAMIPPASSTAIMACGASSTATRRKSNECSESCSAEAFLVIVIACVWKTSEAVKHLVPYQHPSANAELDVRPWKYLFANETLTSESAAQPTKDEDQTNSRAREPAEIHGRPRRDDSDVLHTKCFSSRHGSTRWCRIAYRTSSTVECRLSFEMIRARCVAAVFVLMPSNTPICLLVLPSATRRRTSRSRGVSRADA